MFKPMLNLVLGKGALPVAAALLSLTGCALLGGASEEQARAEEPETRLVVENRNWADVTIYILRAGTRVRLGLATSMNRTQFVIPADIARLATDLRLVADPIGGDPYLSETVSVRPGDEVEFRIAEKLELSAVSVRHGGGTGSGL